MPKRIRLPNLDDFKSDTVKTLGVVAFVQLIEAVAQLLAVFGVVDNAITDAVIAGSPYITVILTYVAVFFRVNVKTDL